MNDTPTPNLSGYRLERFALDELGDAEHEQVLQKLHANNQNPDQIKADIQASNTEILTQYPASVIAARIQNRLQKNQQAAHAANTKPRSTKPRFLAAALTTTALAAALLAVFVLPGEFSSTEGLSEGKKQRYQNTPEPGIRYKGLEPSLQVWRQTATSADRLSNAAQASAGDRLQLRFQAAGAPYGVIVSIDGRNQTTLHFPDFEGGDTALAPGAATLNHSYLLDDAPDFERFFLITSENPIDSTAVLDALDKLSERADASTAHPTLSEDLSWTDFLVNKP